MLTKQCQAHLQQTTLRRALRNMNLRDDKCQTCSEHKPSGAALAVGSGGSEA